MDDLEEIQAVTLAVRSINCSKGRAHKCTFNSYWGITDWLKFNQHRLDVLKTLSSISLLQIPFQSMHLPPFPKILPDPSSSQHNPVSPSRLLNNLTRIFHLFLCKQIITFPLQANLLLTSLSNTNSHKKKIKHRGHLSDSNRFFSSAVKSFHHLDMCWPAFEPVNCFAREDAERPDHRRLPGSSQRGDSERSTFFLFFFCPTELQILLPFALLNYSFSHYM